MPKAEFVEVVVPGGTSFDVTLETPLASNRSRIEDPVRARVAADVVVRGRLAIPAGTEVSGTVLQATAAGRANGRAALALRFLQLRLRDTAVRFQTDRITRDGPSANDDIELPAGTSFRLSLDDAIRVRVPNE
jgi:hypothetical protein